jgi:fused signal recognition particle receptor
MASESKSGFFQRLKERLTRPGGGLGSGLARLFGARRIDAEVLEELETRLLAADVGASVTEELLEGLRSRVARQQLNDVDALLAALRDDITAMLSPVAKPLVVDRSAKPYAILVVGVNGSGKTTTIGKLAHRLGQQGLHVVLAAGDTFRAAAVEQIGVWADRTGAELVAQQTGADPAAEGRTCSSPIRRGVCKPSRTSWKSYAKFVA